MRRILLAVVATCVAATALAGCRTAEKPADSASAGKPVSAAEWQAFGDYLQQQADAGQFSGAVLVAEDGKPLLEQGYGMADRERGVANTAQTTFCIASMGKMFTAVAIAQLKDQGKLTFGDTIGQYVSGFPPEVADKVTIDQLLTHTSGMGDAALSVSPVSAPPSTMADLMQRIVATPLQSEPGSRFGYSNDGFIVLGAIIEHITGQSYADYVREHIFKSAGMADTDIRAYVPNDIPGMAHGHMQVDQNGRPLPPEPGAGRADQPATLRDNADTLQIGNPSGGAISTVGDLLAFATALTGHKLISPALTDTILAGKVDSDRPGGPPENRYGYGFSDQEINGVRIVGHNGGTPGYEAQLDMYPDRGYTVIILTNQDRVLLPAIRRSEDLLTR